MKHRQAIRSVTLSLSIVAALSLAARPAPACGGPDMGDFGALSPADSSLFSIMTPGDYVGSWGQQQRDEFRFLYPSWKAHPRELDGLWRFSYGEVDTLAGYIATRIGRVPVRGELVPGPGPFEIEVLDADPRRVKKLKIYRSADRRNGHRSEAPRRPAEAAPGPAQPASPSPHPDLPPARDASVKPSPDTTSSKTPPQP